MGSVTINAPEDMADGVITGEIAVGTIEVRAEDLVAKRDDLKDGAGNPIEDPGPIGELFDTSLYVYPSDTMTTVIARACLLTHTKIGIRGKVGSGMGCYIYQIGDRTEFDRGQNSGWMGSLNGWYTNTGFDNYKISDGSLQPGDIISLKYTTDLGDDIGAPFGDATNRKKLKSLTIVPTSGLNNSISKR